MLAVINCKLSFWFLCVLNFVYLTVSYYTPFFCLLTGQQCHRQSNDQQKDGKPLHKW